MSRHRGSRHGTERKQVVTFNQRTGSETRGWGSYISILVPVCNEEVSSRKSFLRQLLSCWGKLSDARGKTMLAQQLLLKTIGGLNTRFFRQMSCNLQLYVLNSPVPLSCSYHHCLLHALGPLLTFFPAALDYSVMLKAGRSCLLSLLYLCTCGFM